LSDQFSSSSDGHPGRTNRVFAKNLSYGSVCRIASSVVSRSLLTVFLLATASLTTVYAGGPIVSIDTSRSAATSAHYESSGESYYWGIGENQRIEGFNFLGNEYRFVSLASEARVQFAQGHSPEICNLFAEQTDSPFSLAPSFASASLDECPLAELFEGRIINRGSLDTFTNTPPGVNDSTLAGVAGNVERVDIFFDTGIVTPVQPGLLDSAGHIVADMRGDNAVQIAAITSISPSGEITGFGPLRTVEPAGCAEGAVCYGTTFQFHQLSLLSRSSATGNLEVVDQGLDAVAVAFVSAQELGLAAGQTYYGFSLFATDVNASSHNLVDTSTFPADTGNSADLYGGMGAYFLLGGTSVAHGHVFIDLNSNGMRETGETETFRLLCLPIILTVCLMPMIDRLVKPS